ncbi:MAG: tetratricopeptide repeat protein [Pyrinomonadaceae bacterium]
MITGITRVFAFFILSFCVGSLASAQIPYSGTLAENSRRGGANVIAGTVHWPDGSKADRRINVKVRPQTGGDFFITTDTSGQFVIINLPEGIYHIIIDREDAFEPVDQTVELVTNGDELKPVYSVSIRLVEKRKPEPKPSILKVESIGVTDRARNFYLKALDLAKAADHAGAVQQLKLAVAEFPTFFEAFNELGVQYQKLNDLPNAELSLRSALNIKPGGFEPTLNLAIVLFRLAKYKEAETLLRDAVKLKDSAAIPHFYLGRTLAKLALYDEAEKELILSIAIGGAEMNEAHRMLAMMYIDKDDRAKAVSALETYLKLVPTAPDAEKLRDAIKQLKGQ